jgi:hypothetical protein
MYPSEDWAYLDDTESLLREVRLGISYATYRYDTGTADYFTRGLLGSAVRALRQYGRHWERMREDVLRKITAVVRDNDDTVRRIRKAYESPSAAYRFRPWFCANDNSLGEALQEQRTVYLTQLLEYPLCTAHKCVRLSYFLRGYKITPAEAIESMRRIRQDAVCAEPDSTAADEKAALSMAQVRKLFFTHHAFHLDPQLWQFTPRTQEDWDTWLTDSTRPGRLRKATYTIPLVAERPWVSAKPRMHTVDLTD